MNLNHAIDYNRPFAREYEEARKDVRFWNALKAPTQQAIVMFFSDSTLPIRTAEVACGACVGSIRGALRTRGLFGPDSAAGWTANHKPNAYKGPTGSGGERRHPNITGVGPRRRAVGCAEQVPQGSRLSAVTDAIKALESQRDDVGRQMRALNTEWDRINAAIDTLKGL